MWRADSGSGGSGTILSRQMILIMLAVFAQTGTIPLLADGSVHSIDLDTLLVVIFGFPTMLILRKSIQDDGPLNLLETASMVGLFGLIIIYPAGS